MTDNFEKKVAVDGPVVNAGELGSSTYFIGLCLLLGAYLMEGLVDQFFVFRMVFLVYFLGYRLPFVVEPRVIRLFALGRREPAICCGTTCHTSVCVGPP